MAENADENGQETEEETTQPNKLFPLIVTSFVLVFIGIFITIAALAMGGNSSASAGIVIFIGPIPIIVGAGSDAAWLILTSIILATISMVLFVITRRKFRERVG